MTEAAAAAPIFFDPLDEGYSSSPWPHFADLRRHDPVHHSPLGQWFLFRYEDVSRLLRDPSLSVDDANVTVSDEERLAVFRAEFGEAERSNSMLGHDVPLPECTFRGSPRVERSHQPARCGATRDRCRLTDAAGSRG